MAADALLGDILASRDLGSNLHQAPCARPVVREVSEQPLGKLTSLRGGRGGEGPLERCQSHWARLTGLLPGQEVGEEAGQGGRSSGLYVNPLLVGVAVIWPCRSSPGLTVARLLLSPCVASLLTRSVSCNPDRWSWSICDPRC